MTVAIIGSANPSRIPNNVREVWISDATLHKYPYYARIEGTTCTVFNAHDIELPKLGKGSRVIDVVRDHQWVETIEKEVGPRFSNTLCYMVGYAIRQAYRIRCLYMTGVRMYSNAEYLREISNLSWLLGYATAEGIETIIESPSALMPPARYPYDREVKEEAYDVIELEEVAFSDDIPF